MKVAAIFTTLVMVLVLLLACAPEAPAQTPATPTEPASPPEAPAPQTPSADYLTPNPVETAMPIYGGTLQRGYWIPRTFDAHQKVSYGPTATLPVFNQLVIFNINYKETMPETIIGDLAESWETSADGLSITFKLHQGIKWHDGMPFTSDDVIYSLDKMADPKFSAISGWFPAYQNTEKIDEYNVKINLKYPSAGFMLSLAQGESQIQPLHLSNVDPQSKEFMVGTGPFILTDYLPQVHLKYKRNPDYFRKDKYGNQLPYLDGMVYYHLALARAAEMTVGRRLDLPDVMTGAATTSTYEFLKNGAPELLWQKRERYNGLSIMLNLNHKPLDDIRVRRAMGLVLVPEDLIIGYGGDVMFGLPGAGILHPAFGLPKDEIARLMGWDKPMSERIAEAQRLMAEAGYPNGFKLNLLTAQTTIGNAGATIVFSEALRQNLKIDIELSAGLADVEMYKRLDEDKYDTYSLALDIFDPAYLATYFGTGGYANYAKYSNPALDKMLAELDHILDPQERREAIWEIERTLLADLPALPTGCFPPNYMSYYPHVKNLRWNYISYSNINRVEDVWIDESLRSK